MIKLTQLIMIRVRILVVEETLNTSSDTFKCSVSSESEVNEMNTSVNETQDIKFKEFEEAELKKKII